MDENGSTKENDETCETSEKAFFCDIRDTLSFIKIGNFVITADEKITQYRKNCFDFILNIIFKAEIITTRTDNDKKAWQFVAEPDKNTYYTQIIKIRKPKNRFELYIC